MRSLSDPAVPPIQTKGRANRPTIPERATSRSIRDDGSTVRVAMPIKTMSIKDRGLCGRNSFP